MNELETLFDVGPAIESEKEPRTALAPNALVQRPVRNQFEMPIMTLDDRVASDHPVRAVAGVVEELDLSGLESKIDSNTTQGGRPAIDPCILVTLWIWAISQGVFEASEIARRIQTDDVYRWICGGVAVGERTLASFRKSTLDVFESIFTQLVASLMSEGLIELCRVAQDGVRVRAWSGADSFRRAETLEVLLEEAREHYREVLAAANDPTRSQVAKSAAERGARERADRVERALARAKQLGRDKSDEELADKNKAPRASTTDPEATRMKMADGGFRPAYNIQFSTTADGKGAIVGVAATDRGNDFGEISPMLQQIEERSGERPKQALVDGGYVKAEDIEAAEKKGTQVFGPEPKKKADEAGRRARERSPEMATYHARVASEEGKAIYAHRGQVAELTNAHARSRFGLSVILLRGLKGALTIATLIACVNNVNVLIRERAARAAAATQTDPDTPSCTPLNIA
jgi:transposase